MNSITIRIEPFFSAHQAGVDSMLDTIVPEYAEPFFHTPAKKMDELYLLPDRYYWVALADGLVVGTIGIVVANGYAVLKSMFVNKAFRGGDLQVAGKLIQVATDKAKQYGCEYIFLGTMEQFKAAQRFYEKQGYKEIKMDELPLDFGHNPLDTVFYRLQIAAK